MKKFAVIGGGITGCIAALNAVSKGYDVTIFEKEKSLGGILKDVKKDENIFFNSCQYFNPEEKWYKTHIEGNLDFKIFNHRKGSFTDIFDNQIFELNVPNPTCEKKIDLDEIIEKIEKNTKFNLKDRLNFYPRFINDNIFKWVSMHNVNPEDLSWDHPNGFSCGRVFFKENLEEVKLLKKRSKLMDDLLCLPDHERDVHLQQVSVPISGYNKFFDELSKILIKKKIKINLSAVVKPVWDQNNLKIINKGTTHLFDKIFWSGNPTGLIKSFGLPKLDSLNISCKNVYFNLDGVLKEDTYFQIFSKNIPVSRIYFYTLNDKAKLTVETFSKEFSINHVIKFCRNIISKKNWNLNFVEEKPQAEVFQKKYVVVSTRDRKIINDFIKKTKNSNLIPGCWLIYARDSKINFVIKNI